MELQRYRSKSHQTVFNNGVAAAKAGKARKPPYADSRGGVNNNCITGARGYIKAWLAGYDAEIGSCSNPSRS